MKFTKMHGAGNDFIIINNIKEQVPEECLGALARVLCRRRTAIGADGLMAVTEAKDGGDFAMLFFNSDGTLGEMCGNGARCIARYGYEKGLSGERPRIETTAGQISAERLSEDRYRVHLNDPSVIRLGVAAMLDGNEYVCDYFELGSPGLPHAVVRFDSWRETEQNTLREIGRGLRCHHEFPKGANVTFWSLRGDGFADAVTFERGVEDFTLACGTGAGCTAAAMTLRGFASGQVGLSFPGGELGVSLTSAGTSVSEIYLEGSAVITAEGDVGDALLKETVII